ncbi:MAG: dephospho-CoA kinase [Methylococcales symbiont of Hymedesmia sp. n. MRB-2018]|nr:MAG: dephospho-CoA kinase [Methylococcales symbiont of Hymedesmia sp. n. MRB-2018]
MFKIGLTGGVGSGKSTVATLFNNFNIPIIDADDIARQLVAPKQAALTLIQQAFGNTVFAQNGSLDRDKLRDIIFTHADKKKQLEAILHPLIYQKMLAEFARQTSAYSIFCIPLLMETKMISFVDHVLVVDCLIETQIERVKERNKLSRAQALSIINSQVSREFRLKHADDVIDNSKSISGLADQVKKLHNQYLLLSNGTQ